MQQTHTTNRWLYFFVAIAVLVNLSGLFVPLMNPDATLYATIAKTMVQRNDYVNILVRGTDWLDKPHFPFWVAAVFFKLFGINTWAYKLSGIVFMLMGAAYTWLFARILYNRQVALWAVLILLTAQHIVLSNNDVRAEPYLTGLIIASVYHFYCVGNRGPWWHLLLACLFAGCAVMTKGVFALITIGSAVFGHLLITRQWRQILHWRWVLAAVLVLIFILPEVYCLYIQFDSQPQKVVFGQQGVSGIRFFFWDSQFGRFFNTGPIKGSGDPSFFLHTTLWAFLPWSLLLFAAIYQFFKQAVKNVKGHEWYNLCGALVTFVMFSASKFQLPHYLNIVFPFFAILTARYLCGIKQPKSMQAIRVTQWAVCALLLAILVALHYFYEPAGYKPVVLAVIIILPVILLLLPAKWGQTWYDVVGITCVIVSFTVNLYLNLIFYPDVLKYQAGSEAALWINQHNPHKMPVLQAGDDVNFAMEFYLDQPMMTTPADGSGSLPRQPFMLYAPAELIAPLTARGMSIQPLKTFERYAITRLKPSFLNKATRAKELTMMQLVLVTPAPRPANRLVLHVNGY